jgi:hypothetical protein
MLLSTARAPITEVPLLHDLRAEEIQPLPADRCVPAGRLPFDLGAEEVYCFTLTTAAALGTLQTTGTVGPDTGGGGARGDFDDSFAAAYDWMRWQMYRHLDGYTGGFPIWVWARTRRRDLVDNIKTTASLLPGSVLLTLRIPRRHLLLTDYMYWHDVLNGHPSCPLRCPRCGRPHCEEPQCLDLWFDPWSETWDARIPRGDGGERLPWWSWPPDLQSELFDSWESVRQTRPRWPVQGCVERLQANWVTGVNQPA